MKTSESIDLFCVALVKAQEEAQHANFDSKNPHFKSKYASLAEVIDTMKAVLARHELAVIQMPEYREGLGHVLTSRIIHKSGQWLETEMLMNPVKNDPQGVGSAITYAKRQSLTGVLCIASEDDDDGNAASHAPTVTNEKARAETLASIKKHLDSLNSEDEIRRFFPSAVTRLNAMKGSKDYNELTALCQARIAATKSANDEKAAA
jgi:hypothetical protein